MAEYDVSNIEDGTGDRFNFAAKKLENPVNVSIDGDVVGSTSTDLSNDVVINAELSQDVKDTLDTKANKNGSNATGDWVKGSRYVAGSVPNEDITDDMHIRANANGATVVSSGTQESPQVIYLRTTGSSSGNNTSLGRNTQVKIETDGSITLGCEAIGSSSQPVYVNSSGQFTPCGFSGLNYSSEVNYSPTADELKSNNIITYFAALSANRNINIYFDRMLENVNYRVMAYNTAVNNYQIKIELWSTSGSGVNVKYYTRLATGTISNGAHVTLATNPAGINLIRVGTSVYAFGY